MKAQRVDYLSKVAEEEGSYTIKLTFKDEDGVAFAPSALIWTLMTEDGQILNSRYRISVAEPAAITYITMSGDDLQLVDKRFMYETRVFTLEGTYNSTYGNSLPIKRQYFFKVRNLILIAIPLAITVEEVIFTNDYVEDVNA